MELPYLRNVCGLVMVMDVTPLGACVRSRACARVRTGFGVGYKATAKGPAAPPAADPNLEARPSRPR